MASKEIEALAKDTAAVFVSPLENRTLAGLPDTMRQLEEVFEAHWDTLTTSFQSSDEAAAFTRGTIERLTRRLDPAPATWMDAARWASEATGPHGEALAAVAAATLNDEGGAASPLAGPLAGRLARSLVELRQRAGLDSPTPPSTQAPDEAPGGGMLAATAAAVEYLAELGHEDYAKGLADRGRERWATWRLAFDTCALAKENPRALDLDTVGHLAKLTPIIVTNPERLDLTDPERLDLTDPADRARLAAMIEQGGEVVGLAEWAEIVRDRTAVDLWKPWQDKEERGKLPPVAMLLAHALLPKVREAERKQEKPELKPYHLRTVTVGDDRYAKADKHIAAVSWAFGAPGVEVKVEDDHYRTQPNMMGRFRSRSAELLTSRMADEARRAPLLPFDLHDIGQAEDSLPMAAVSLARSGGAELLPSTAGKAALLMLSSAPVNGDAVGATLGELARVFYPNADRIRPTHLTSTARALWYVKGLHLVTPQDEAVPLLSVALPSNPSAAATTQQCAWARAPVLQRYLPKAEGELRGELLLNFSGAMRLDARKGGLLRAYVRAADLWNRRRQAWGKDRGNLRPDAIPWMEPQKWAALVNALSARAAAYLSGKKRTKGARSAASREPSEALNDLKALDAVGLLCLELKGPKRNRKLRVLPPAALEEAWRLLRSGQHNDE